MLDQVEPKLSKWPFFLASALLLGAAVFVGSQTQRPIGVRELALVVSCVAAGVVLGIAPFFLQYSLHIKLLEVAALGSVVSQIKNLEAIAVQISGATGQWQTVQEHADKIASASRETQERMAAEAKAFAEFMQSANDNEKATLKLEVEKLRRAEQDWRQGLGGMLAQTYDRPAGA